MSASTLPRKNFKYYVEKPTKRVSEGRAKILAIGGRKGGVTKSTTAMFLALAYVLSHRARVLVIDADPANSASWMWSYRAAALANAEGSEYGPLPFDVEEMNGRSQMAEKLESKGWANAYDIIIVDTGGEGGDVFVEAATLADYILMPVSPSNMDIDSLVKGVEDARKAVSRSHKKPVSLLLTKCVSGSRMAKKARADLAPLEKMGVRIMSNTVPHSVWYQGQYGQLPVDNKRVSARHYAAVQYEMENPGTSVEETRPGKEEAE